MLATYYLLTTGFCFSGTSSNYPEFATYQCILYTFLNSYTYHLLYIYYNYNAYSRRIFMVFQNVLAFMFRDFWPDLLFCPIWVWFYALTTNKLEIQKLTLHIRKLFVLSFTVKGREVYNARIIIAVALHIWQHESLEKKYN